MVAVLCYPRGTVAQRLPRRTVVGMATPDTFIPVIHDGDGTWFAPHGLQVVLLTDEEIRQLEDEGDESVLKRWSGVCLGELLDEHVQLGDVAWAWPQ